MTSFKQSLIFFLAVCSVILHADFTHVSVWQRIPKSGEKQLLVMCGDTHSREKVGLDQAEQVVALLADHRRPDDCILVEDLSDMVGLAKRIDRFFEHYPCEEDRKEIARSLHHVHYELIEGVRTQRAQERKQISLFLLPYCARACDVPIYNIDFRQCVSCDTPRPDIAKYQKGSEIIPWVIEQIVKEIEGFDDMPLLNAHYAEVVARYKPFMQTITKIMRENKIIFQELPEYFAHLLVDNPDALFLEGLESIRTTNLRTLYQKLYQIKDHFRKTKDYSSEMEEELFNILIKLLDLSSVELIDAMLLHEMYQRQAGLNIGNTIFMCAGKAHKAIVEELLPGLGYELLGKCVDEDGVDIDEFCTPFMVQGSDNPIAYVWSYVRDTVGSVVEYMTDLFVA